MGYLTGAHHATGGSWPGKEREYGSGVAGVVAEVEVVCSRIIEVHGLFDKTQAENAGVKVQITLRVARNCSYMIQPFDRFGSHCNNSFAVIRFDIELKDSERLPPGKMPLLSCGGAFGELMETRCLF